MLGTVLKELARDWPLIFPGGGQNQGGFLSGMSEFGETGQSQVPQHFYFWVCSAHYDFKSELIPKTFENEVVC